MAPISSQRDIAPTVLVYGYYGQHNTGDDAFMEVFKWIYRNRPEQLVFCSPEEAIPALPYEYCILGGGDVLNDYFMEPLIKYLPNIPIYAIGVGMPYANDNTGFLQLIIARNHQLFGDLPFQYYPDLAFLLQYVTGLCPMVHLPAFSGGHGGRGPAIIAPTYQSIKPRGRRMKIGVSLPRSWYNPNYAMDYANLCRTVGQALAMIAILEDAEIHFIAFSYNDAEHDRTLYDDIALHMAMAADRIVFVDLNPRDPLHGHRVYETLEYIGYMDFMICGRFHAHIFSIIHHRAFISLSCSRKCELLMEDLGMPLFRLTTNGEDVPVALDFTFVDRCREAIRVGAVSRAMDDLVPLDIFQFIN